MLNEAVFFLIFETNYCLAFFILFSSHYNHYHQVPCRYALPVIFLHRSWSLIFYISSFDAIMSDNTCLMVLSCHSSHLSLFLILCPTNNDLFVLWILLDSCTIASAKHSLFVNISVYGTLSISLKKAHLCCL